MAKEPRSPHNEPEFGEFASAHAAFNPPLEMPMVTRRDYIALLSTLAILVAAIATWMIVTSASSTTSSGVQPGIVKTFTTSPVLQNARTTDSYQGNSTLLQPAAGGAVQSTATPSTLQGGK